MDQALSMRVKAGIVRALHLPIAPETIGDDVPLFGEGLGLDSVDALELVLELEREFGVKVTDDQLGRRALRTVSAIVGLIEENQAQSTTSQG
jgi:acyl carrier protein